MKNVYFIFIFLGVSFYASSQVNYGIEVGYVFNDIEASNVTCKSQPSFRIGGFIHYSENVESGVYFSRRGMKLTNFDPQYAGKIEQLDFYSNYLEVIPFSATISEGKLFSGHVFWDIATGFYASYGFGGNGNIMIDSKTVELKNIYKNQDLAVNNSIYSYKAFKPFDYGVNLEFKLLLDKKLFFRCILPVSLRNNMTPYDKKITSSASPLSLGYIF